MRIVSLLPSATEIVYALGLGDQLVGVTHDCDFPSEARTKARVSRTLLPPDASPAEIDRLVSAASVPGGEPTEVLEEDVLARLDPELILTQDLCAVCAIPTDDVEAALTTLGCQAEVVSLDPGSIDEVLDGITRVGAATGTADEAAALVAGLRDRVAHVQAAVAGRPRRRVLVLEWGDPTFNGGHWIPEMVELAGGTPVLGEPGRDSVRVSWEQIAAADAEVVVFSPCGYSLAEAAAEGAFLLDRAELAGAEVWAVDADGLFVRPGPRLVDGIEALAALLHPDAVAAPPGSAQRLRP